ncbi:glycoside hydrolase family 3 protein [Alkalicoccus luteus]|uniref:beta-N-acetylhexosaminidase n=1 Tax=Alkalicoccus luteus TaxID=1237094 RepID=A0A969PSC4_9BACI|nr:glycoside hydrolase family 3 protein [Alkalicoccus luteus]NJP37068.1 glycoside hydrolase family 3 protein [Alkalicoccus luteus]
MKKAALSVLAGTMLLTHAAPAAVAQESDGDLILYQNVPGVETDLEEGLDLRALAVHEDGHFTERSEGLEWSSTNENVATVDDNGVVEMTGQRGRTFISVSDGEHTDRIAVDYKPNPDARDGGGPPPVEAQLVPQSGERYDIVDGAVEGMTLEEKVGQMMMPDFRHYDGQEVTEMLPEIEQLVEDYHLGGVILFAENVVETEQTYQLVHDYQEAAEKFGMLVTIDQEGGIVTRLQTGTDLPGNMALGATRNLELSEAAGDVIGAELSSLGINTNLAPVVDVNNNPDNPVIGVRSFGEDPQLVADMGVSYINGLQQNGIAATAKHFPGHGDTAVDSHLGLPEVPHDLDRLMDVELYPFQQAMDAGLDAVMTAHVTFPQIDGSKAISEKDGTEISIPATLSRTVLTDLMRDELGYDGVVMTDAMNMNAITDHFGPVDAAIRAIDAGADIILMPVGLEEVVDGVLDAVDGGDISEAELDESVERILTLKVERGIFKQESPQDPAEGKQGALDTIGQDSHLAVEQTIADDAVTMLKNDDVLPLTPDAEERIAVVGTTYLNSLVSAVGEHHQHIDAVNLSGQSSLTDDQRSTIEAADHVVIGSTTATVAQRSADNAVMQMYAEVMDMKDDVAAVAIRNPYDIMAYPDVDAYLAQYGFRDASFRATAAVLFGEENPTGTLPVTIPDPDGGTLFEYGSGISFE